jgi:hypothetical protein
MSRFSTVEVFPLLTPRQPLLVIRRLLEAACPSL